MERIDEKVLRQTDALDRMTTSNMKLSAVQEARLEFDQERLAKDEAKERRREEQTNRRTNWLMDQFSKHGVLIVVVGLLVFVQACAPQLTPYVAAWLTGGAVQP